jgi:hypothetical protein
MTIEREMLIERLSTALSDYEYDNGRNLPDDLADYLVDSGFSDGDYEEPEAPEAPEAPTKERLETIAATARIDAKEAAREMDRIEAMLADARNYWAPLDQKARVAQRAVDEWVAPVVPEAPSHAYSRGHNTNIEHWPV